MGETLFNSLSLVDASGYVIIAAILSLLVASIFCTSLVRGRYAQLERDLRGHMEAGQTFEAPVLNHIVGDALAARRRHAAEVNTQAIIDQHFQSDLPLLLLGERFVKSVTGLLIILGLVGTFYGLTLSIGKLVALLSGTPAGATELAESLTLGLTQALSGMSVAFSTSLFGISAAIITTLMGVFRNVGDRRLALMVQLEGYLDNVVLSAPASDAAVAGGAQLGGGAVLLSDDRLEQVVHGFGLSVSRLEGVVGEFHQALQTFSGSTREFGELNSHLKDNIQRMSLGFADLGDTLKDSVKALQSRNRD